MPRESRERETRERIIATLSANKEGLTISDLSRVLGIHYTTASKYLAVLEAENKLTHRDIGMAKVFKLKEVIA